MNDKVQELQKLIDTHNRIVFFGGAGVSTESGVPDFRSVDGLYNQKYDYPPETILSHTFFMRKPEEFYKFYRDKILIEGEIPAYIREQLSLWESLLAHLNEGKSAHDFVLPDSEAYAKTWAEFGLLTAKPAILVANVDESAIEKGNRYSEAVEHYAKSHNLGFSRICAKFEEELQALSEDEQKEMLASYALEESGLEKIIRTGYATLGLISYFTAGPDEVRAWTIHKGWKAPQAAGVIHTDFERGFIRAEVIAFNDYMRYKNEAECRALAALRTEGKDYVVEDGDVMHFLFNV